MKKLLILMALAVMVAVASCGKKEDAGDKMESTANDAATQTNQMADSMADTAAAMADSMMGDSM